MQIKKKMNISGHGTIKWEYFEAFQEIFASDKTINVGSTISSTPVEPSSSYSSSSMEAASKLSLNISSLIKYNISSKIKYNISFEIKYNISNKINNETNKT